MKGEDIHTPMDKDTRTALLKSLDRARSNLEVGQDTAAADELKTTLSKIAGEASYRLEFIHELGNRYNIPSGTLRSLRESGALKTIGRKSCPRWIEAALETAGSTANS